MARNFYNGYDSNEEQYFNLWVDELLKYGYIEKYIYQPEPFKINDKVEIDILVELKTKTKLKKCTLLHPREYTPDYKIYWSEKVNGILYQNLNSIKNKRPLIIAQDNVSYIDIKGKHNQHSSWAIFECNRKDVWEKYNIFVEKLEPFKLFAKSFTPKDLPIWQKRDPTKKYAWAKWNILYIEEFFSQNTHLYKKT